MTNKTKEFLNHMDNQVYQIALQVGNEKTVPIDNLFQTIKLVTECREYICELDRENKKLLKKKNNAKDTTCSSITIKNNAENNDKKTC
jgi:hypothetical protein